MNPLFFKITSLLFIISVSYSTFANTWQSITEQKYKASYPVQYAKYSQVVNLLDTYSVSKGKQLAEAELILSDIFEKKPEFSPAYVQAARLLVYSGYLRSPESIKIIHSLMEKALQIEPNYAEAYLYYASIYRMLGDWNSVEKQLLLAKQSGTKSPWYDIHMGRLLKHKSNIPEAMKYFDLVFTRQDITAREKSYASIELRDYYNSIQDFNKSKKYYIEVTKLKPEDPYSWGNAAVLMLYTLGEIDSAIEYFEKAVTLAPYKMATKGLSVAYFSKWAQQLDDNPVLAKSFLVKAQAIGLSPQQVYNLCATDGRDVLNKTLEILEREYDINQVKYVLDPKTGKAKLL
jgi:tetratricopeptide (TPR) repeat protein